MNLLEGLKGIDDHFHPDGSGDQNSEQQRKPWVSLPQVLHEACPVTRTPLRKLELNHGDAFAVEVLGVEEGLEFGERIDLRPVGA